jgi:DNA-3-methyladenine glycosylase II
VAEGKPLEIAVMQTGPSEAAALEVKVIGARIPPITLSAVTATLERLLGLRTDLGKFYRLAAGDRKLGPMVERFRGVKPPRYPTLFECLVNGIACQQITLALGVRLVMRLAEAHGPALRNQDGVFYAFPRPEDLAPLKPEALRELGFSRQKALALTELACALAERRLDLEGLSALGNEEALACLQELRGVGRWTAEYTLIRGLGRLHVFPGDDVGARRNLGSWLGLKEPLDYEGVNRLLRRFKPYAGLVYFHLLLENLAKAGHLQ